MITTGWYDQFLPGGINAFTALRNRDAGEPMAQGTRMIIGFWGHGVPGEPIGPLLHVGVLAIYAAAA